MYELYTRVHGPHGRDYGMEATGETVKTVEELDALARLGDKEEREKR